MYLYRVNAYDDPGRFRVIETNMKGMGSRTVNRDPLCYDDALRMADAYAAIDKTSFREADLFDLFRENYPRHTWAIDQMGSETRSQWVFKIFMDAIREEDLVFLWRTADLGEQQRRDGCR